MPLLGRQIRGEGGGGVAKGHIKLLGGEVVRGAREAKKFMNGIINHRGDGGLEGV